MIMQLFNMWWKWGIGVGGGFSSHLFWACCVKGYVNIYGTKDNKVSTSLHVQFLSHLP